MQPINSSVLWPKGQSIRWALAIIVGLVTVACDAPKSPAVENMLRLKFVGILAGEYSRQHEGRFPSAIQEVAPLLAKVQDRQAQEIGMPQQRINSWDELKYRDPDSGVLYDWLYFTGHTSSDPDTAIIAASPTTVGKGKSQRIVLRANLTVGSIPEAKYEKQIMEQEHDAKGK